DLPDPGGRAHEQGLAVRAVVDLLRARELPSPGDLAGDEPRRHTPELDLVALAESGDAQIVRRPSDDLGPLDPAGIPNSCRLREGASTQKDEGGKQQKACPPAEQLQKHKEL